MDRRYLLAAAVLLSATAAQAETKTKRYSDPEGCIRSYQLALGRVLTSQGLIEDPTVNAMMKDAVAAQMKTMNIAEAQHPDMEVRFMGGNGAGLQVDDLRIGDMAIWDIGGPQAVSSRTYKKTTLVIGAFDNRSKRTVWAAVCSDKFGDPAKMRERINKAVSQAFAKFPKQFVCGAP